MTGARHRAMDTESRNRVCALVNVRYRPSSFLLRCLPLAFHFSRADKCVSDCGPSHNTAPRLGGGRPGPPCEFPPLGFRITKAPIARAGSPYPPRPHSHRCHHHLSAVMLTSLRLLPHGR